MRRLNGVELYKYRPYAPGGSRTSFVVEYLYSFFATLALSLKASLRGRFAIVQSCNPPDLFWPIGLLFRLLHNSSFVFDHHDLCPELYQSRFPNGSQLIYQALRLMERCTIRTADHVISTNDSYRQIVMGRDGVDAGERHRRPHRPRHCEDASDDGRSKPATRQASSGCVHRRDGATGWRRSRLGAG